MRILYLHQHFSQPSGATATRAHAMATALAAAGHKVTIACGAYEGAVTGLTGRYRRGRRSGRVGPVEVVEFAIHCGNAQGFAARMLAFLRFALAAARLAVRPTKGAWDVIIASSTPLTVALPALWAKRRRGTPFVFEIRDPWPELPRAISAWSRGTHTGASVPGPVLAAMEPLANAACRRAAAVIALSDGMAETARARGAARVHVVPNGCDLDLFGPHIIPWRPAEAASCEILAVYAGAHGRANGLELLLNAASILQTWGDRRVRIVLVGTGGEKAGLMARAVGLRNVTFLEPMPKTRLAGLLAGSQIGLQCLAPVPEFAEWTSPNKLMDYMAAGLPVVANMEGRAARILAVGPCGIATPPNNHAAFAAALLALADDPARRRALGEAGRQQAVRQWGRLKLAQDFVAAVEAAAA
ncbi:glycosyltransferase involved in cell wall biosynthesis [Humitalea rosea]|uniref:Glycosyltransferase involved in cell wall biosynthesis n=1 Tax=Humitalea rosea TaxID=990373 RepID=A0A2W7ILR1_9PROT|nr:glycosyltransferase family 4 protein [Humitalea rosea]PZW46651.1 glycosyltransferase involved in cell wall biosynthesis [Humitalea rosea]